MFTDGKRKYKEWLQIEVDESGANMRRYNLQKRETESIPLTADLKYSLITSQIRGSGNKAVIYKHLQSLTPKAQAKVEEPEAGSETVTINGEGAEVVRNKQEMRLQLKFDGKPDASTREKLKANGFRWAPSHGAWQRLLNENSECALKRITDK